MGFRRDWKREEYQVTPESPPVTVLGHTISAVQSATFQRLMLKDRRDYIAEDYGLTIRQIRDWESEPWWLDLAAEWARINGQKVFWELNQRADEIVAGFMDVVNSTDPKTAMARVSAMRTFAEMGDSPIIKGKSGGGGITINNNTVNVTAGSLDMAKLNELSAEQLAEIARGGQIPAELKVVNP